MLSRYSNHYIGILEHWKSKLKKLKFNVASRKEQDGRVRDAVIDFKCLRPKIWLRLSADDIDASSPSPFNWHSESSHLIDNNLSIISCNFKKTGCFQQKSRSLTRVIISSSITATSQHFHMIRSSFISFLYWFSPSHLSSHFEYPRLCLVRRYTCL